MVEGIEGGDAAGPADRLGRKSGGPGGGCGAVLVWALGGGPGPPALVV